MIFKEILGTRMSMSNYETSTQNGVHVKPSA